MLPSVGATLGGYLILAPLGSGGQGSVFRVRDRQGRELALKLFNLRGPTDEARARREAAILSSLSDPALVRFFGPVEEAGHFLGLALELVVGENLGDLIARGALRHEARVAVLAHVATALAAIHDAGLVHRDVKPENVIISQTFWSDPPRRGSVKLVDFGIASAIGDEAGLTRADSWIGTAAYVPPEIIDPATWPGGERGVARDIFAFGVLACELMLGRHPTGLPRNAGAPELSRAYSEASLGKRAWPPPNLPEGWGSVVGDCLALQPRGRPDSGRALLERLRSPGRERGPKVAAVTTPHPRAADPAPMAREPTREVRTAAPEGRFSVREMFLAATVLVLLGLVVGMVLMRPSEPVTQPTAPPPVAPTLVAPPHEGPCCGGELCKPGGSNVGRSHLYCDAGAPSCGACSSGRDIVRLDCEVKLQAEGRYELRLSGVKDPDGKDMNRPPGLRVCMSTAHDRVCTSPNEARLRPTSKRLPIRISDLTVDGIGVEISRSGALIGRGQLKVNGESLGAVALCIGTVLKADSMENVGEVSFFLDDPL